MFELTKRVAETGVTRFFLEGNKDKKVFSLDNFFGINDSQIIAFFFSYELDYLNVIKTLKLLSIPLISAERKSSHPLIIGGGTAITGNPETFRDVLDVIFTGEAEESYISFLNLVLAEKKKEKILETSAKIKGVFVPTISSVYKKVYYKNFPEDFSESVFFTPRGEFGECKLIELTRGCPAKCKFCISRTLYSPPRFADKDLVKDVVKESKINKIGLLGASVSYHPDIKEIMEFIIKEGRIFSISSLRADKVDNDFLELLYRGGNRTITIAPEAGTERLRKLIEKGISEEDIEKTIELSLKKGFSGIRLYFMIGLPEETEEDIVAIVNIGKRIKLIESHMKKRFIKRSFTISPFVPKRNTAFSCYPMEEVKVLSEKINYLRKRLSSEGIEVLYDPPKTARLEYDLSRHNILTQI
ncbi:MAG: B12-binding domain-containing radical SAM protein [Proteobacteria bacterium]|nr:B12-binding domain-containing radical SAM protein [Pseudomonadota bacterium]